MSAIGTGFSWCPAVLRKLAFEGCFIPLNASFQIWETFGPAARRRCPSPFGNRTVGITSGDLVVNKIAEFVQNSLPAATEIRNARAQNAFAGYTDDGHDTPLGKPQV